MISVGVETQYVTIKGVNDGLVFLLDDECAFEDLIQELDYKIKTTHQQILSGPDIHVEIKLGKRVISEEQEQTLRQLLKQQNNLLIQSIHSDGAEEETAPSERHLEVRQGIVRSGQTISLQPSLLYIGDVNPGGTIMSSGDIFILGSLRGMAHAGMDGDEQAVIAASHLRPTQLRIADVISRPPDEWGTEEIFMEFAYLHNGVMEIDKIAQLHRIRPQRLMNGIKGE